MRPGKLGQPVIQKQRTLSGRDARLANLRPFAKGTSGNPGGRPKNSPDMTSLLRAEGGNTVPNVPAFNAVLASLGLKPGCLWVEMDVRALRINAAKGNSRAIQELWERLEGKVPLPVQGVPGGVPIGVDVEIGGGREKILKELAEMNERMNHAGIL